MSLIECLVDPECADKLRQAQGRYTMEDVAVTRYDHKLDTWRITASSGDHTVDAENAGHAYLRFTESHPDDFVQAIVSSVLAEAETDREILEEEANAHALDYPFGNDTER